MNGSPVSSSINCSAFPWSARLTGVSTTLTDKTGAIRSILEALELQRIRKQDDAPGGSGTEKRLLEQVIESNNKMIGLLKVIAEKNLIIDRAAMSNAVDLEFEGGGALKARRSV